MTRLYTEDTNREALLALIDSHYDGYTVIPTIGAWRGQREQSLIIELFETTRLEAITLARSICLLNDQETVAVVTGDDVQYVTRLKGAA